MDWPVQGSFIAVRSYSIADYSAKALRLKAGLFVLQESRAKLIDIPIIRLVLILSREQAESATGSANPALTKEPERRSRHKTHPNYNYLLA